MRISSTMLAFVAIAHLGFFSACSIAQELVANNAVDSSPAGRLSSPSLPADAREIVKQYETEKAEIQKHARKEVRELRLGLVKSLKELQDRYTRDAKLDEAVAIRDRARVLRESGMQTMPDPGMLYSFNNSVGRVLFIRVTGNSQRIVWGTDTYTADSGLASAAVHAGVLKLGQSGVVKVTILPGQVSYQGSTRNGITSSSWNNFPTSFKVEAVSEEDQDTEEESPAVQPVYSPDMPRRGPVSGGTYYFYCIRSFVSASAFGTTSCSNPFFRC